MRTLQHALVALATLAPCAWAAAGDATIAGDAAAAAVACPAGKADCLQAAQARPEGVKALQARLTQPLPALRPHCEQGDAACEQRIGKAGHWLHDEEQRDRHACRD